MESFVELYLIFILDVFIAVVNFIVWGLNDIIAEYTQESLFYIKKDGSGVIYSILRCIYWLIIAIQTPHFDIFNVLINNRCTAQSPRRTPTFPPYSDFNDRIGNLTGTGTEVVS